MYFSYSPSSPATSYTTLPMEIPSSSSTRSQQPSSSSSCAYPSWPRRSSLSSNSSSNSQEEEETHATSYISDDDLFPSVFDDSEADCTPPQSPNAGRSPSASMSRMCEQQIVVDNGALMRELIAQHAREQAAKKERRTRRKSRKSSSHSAKKMSPIPEAGE